jgi:thiosulfate dehydrogenase [quinone] large subunit
MNVSTKYSSWQLTTLVALRMLIGWHLLYEGISKLIHPEWSSIGFLAESRGILSGFAEWLISSENILNAVDFLNTWGLIAIGLGLILGLFTRIASYAGAALLLLYYLMNPPWIGFEPSGPVEGNYLIVNKTIIEAVALLLLAAFSASGRFGLDSLIKLKRNKP